jgi:hypothetical protein
MRHCGNCGASFEPGTLVNSRCPSCGTPIAPSGDVLPTGDIAALDTLTPPSANRAAQPHSNGARSPQDGQDDGGQAAEHGRVLVHVDPHNVVVLDQRSPRATSLILTLLALVALLALAGVAALAGARWGQALQLPPVAATSIPSATVPVTVTAQSFTSPTPSAGTPIAATATPVSGGQPALSVNPTQINAVPCVAASRQFQVRNTGGGSLGWTAKASNSLYTIAPASGSLLHDEAQTVTVSKITLGGQITVDAPGAAGAPQIVSISCA